MDDTTTVVEEVILWNLCNWSPFKEQEECLNLLGYKFIENQNICFSDIVTLMKLYSKMFVIAYIYCLVSASDWRNNECETIPFVYTVNTHK